MRKNNLDVQISASWGSGKGEFFFLDLGGLFAWVLLRIPQSFHYESITCDSSSLICSKHIHLLLHERENKTLLHEGFHPFIGTRAVG